MNCKHAIITGGDLVPYGSTGVQWPECTVCDNPNAPAGYFLEPFDTACDETCPYYEAEEEDTK